MKSTVEINLEQNTSDTKLHVRRKQMLFCYVGTSDGQMNEGYLDKLARYRADV